MKKVVLTALQYFIFFGLGGLLIWWQFHQLNEEDKVQLYKAFGEARDRLWLVAPVLVIGFLSHLFRALRWKLLLQPLHLHPTTANVTFAVLIGYLVNLLIPRMGEVARCTVLAKYEKEPVDKIIGTIVAERSFDLICLVLVTVSTLFLQMETAGSFVASELSGLSIRFETIAIVLAAIAGIIAVFIFLYRRKKDSGIGRFIGGIGAGVLSIRDMQQKGLFLFYTLMIWFCYLSLVYIGFRAIVATEHLGWLAALSVLVFGSVGMIVTPGGIGAYPLAVQKLLETVYHINANYALAFGWVSWMVQTAIVLFLGLASLLLLPIYNVERNGKNTMDKG